MNDIQSRIEKLLDSRFVTHYLSLKSDEGHIAAHVTCFYLDKPDLEAIRPHLNPPTHHADVDQVGCFRALPVCAKDNRIPKGQSIAKYSNVLFTYWIFREIPPISEFRDWVAEQHESKAKTKCAYKALNAFEALSSRAAIGARDLLPILEAAQSPYFVCWDIGMRFLSRLGAKHLVAREAMAEMMTTGKATARVRLLTTLWDHLPKSFCIKLLQHSLRDRSKFVRRVAADMCRRLILSEMAEELRQTASREPDAETKWEMEYAVALIRDAYHVYKQKDGTEAFVVRISDGFPAKLLYPEPGWSSEADRKKKGAMVVAEEIRQKCNGTDRTFEWPRE